MPNYKGNNVLIKELLQLSLQEELTRGAAPDLSSKNLSSFKGWNIPDIVFGEFECQNNQLTSLRYGPTTEVTGNYWCHSNELTSLEYSPTKVKGTFHCSNNQLRNLQHAPTEIGDNFNCNRNRLTSLEHCPNKIDGNFYCDNNKITSLQGIHKSFKGGYINGEIQLNDNPITSHILGLLLIPKLEKVLYAKGNAKCIEAIKIVNKYLAGDRDVIDCQQELIEAGLKEYAQL